MPYLALIVILFKAVLGDYGWAPQRDSNGDSLSGAQLFLGTITNEKELTTSAAEYAKCFQDHFQIVFGATVADNIAAIKTEQAASPSFGFTQAPSAVRIYEAIKHLPNHKALGLDGNASELLKAGGIQLARQVKQLTDKIWAFAYWPFKWRGGKLKELLKKGNPRLRDNYRGLLINDRISKAAACILDDAVDDKYHESLPSSQCGAVRAKGTDIASQLIRCMLDYARMMDLYTAILLIVLA